MREGYIKKAERKTILFLADDMRLHSGIGTMTKELVLGMAHRFNFVQIGGALKHPEAGKVLDISADVNKQIGIDDSSVMIYPVNGYGDPNLVRMLIQKHKVDALVHFTDPRYWIWLYRMSAEIRQNVPIVYYHIWDDLPAPLYNRPYYESCDLLLGISQQSYNISKMVLGEGNFQDVQDDHSLCNYEKNVPKVAYVPHGVNEKVFFPIKEDLTPFMHQLKFFDEYSLPDFIALYNNRNIQRKQTSDIILGFKTFVDQIRKTRPDANPHLILHTDPIDEHGTDLHAVINDLCPDMKGAITIDGTKYSAQDLNKLYNISDVVINLASNEGWGLSSTEALLTGTPIINNVTGGLQDQMRFEDGDGNWLRLTEDYPSNHAGKYRVCGPWATPLFPTSRSLKGSIPTPYIFDDRASWEDLSYALQVVYFDEDRKSKGQQGREWASSEEARFTSKFMANDFADHVSRLLEVWKPISRYELYNVQAETEKHRNKKTGILTSYA